MPEESNWFVYGLFASDRLGKVRYVGKRMTSVEGRLREHLWALQRPGRSKKYSWMKSVLARGAKVCALTYARDLNNDAACALERALIATLPNLTNMTSGGEGRPGYVMSAEVKEKISKAQRGRKFSDAHREALRAGAKGKRFICSAQARANMRASWTPERRAQFSALRRGQKLARTSSGQASLGFN